MVTVTLPLVEPMLIPDIFCSGLADAEDMGDGNMRFTFYSKQKGYGEAGGIEYVIVARLVLPMGSVLSGIQMTMIAAGVKCCKGADMRTGRAH